MDRNGILYNPRTFTLTAEIVGFLLIGDLTAYEQNALGNWFMTIGQILENNSAFQQMIEEKLQGHPYNINSKKYKSGGSPIEDTSPLLNIISDDNQTIEDLQNIINKLKDQIDKLSNQS
jgi:hypothetical protein